MLGLLVSLGALIQLGMVHHGQPYPPGGLAGALLAAQLHLHLYRMGACIAASAGVLAATALVLEGSLSFATALLSQLARRLGQGLWAWGQAARAGFNAQVLGPWPWAPARPQTARRRRPRRVDRVAPDRDEAGADAVQLADGAIIEAAGLQATEPRGVPPCRGPEPTLEDLAAAAGGPGAEAELRAGI